MCVRSSLVFQALPQVFPSTSKQLSHLHLKLFQPLCAQAPEQRQHLASRKTSLRENSKSKPSFAYSRKIFLQPLLVLAGTTLCQALASRAGSRSTLDRRVREFALSCRATLSLLH